MKTIFRTAAITALLITASCGKDSAETPLDQTNEQTEQLEQTPLEVNKVSDNLVIVGSTKKDGVPPAPSGTLSFNVTSASKNAFLREGFDVSLTHDAEIVGAYIQINEAGGTVADGFYDINIDANNSAGKRFIRTKKGKSIANNAKKETETTLDVDFTAEIAPGKFCYKIWVYDANGNISNPEEVCLTIQSWGGKAEAVGKWELVKQYADSSPNDIYLPMVDNCENSDDQRSCAEGAVKIDYSSESCTKIEYFEITLNSDGTYTEREKETYKRTITNVDIPEGLTMDNLNTICNGDWFSDSESIDTYEGDGYWSYIDDEDRFLFFEYNYEEISDGETYSDSNEPGSGYIYYGAGGVDGEVKIVDGNLVISSFEWNTYEFKK